MNKLSNRKALAEVKASLDALQQKYKDKEEDDEDGKENPKHSKYTSNLKDAINQYIKKVNRKIILSENNQISNLDEQENNFEETY